MRATSCPGQRQRLERVGGYAPRPPVAQDRLHLTADGQVRVVLRCQPWRDGTTDVVFDPVEFLGRRRPTARPAKLRESCGRLDSTGVD
jgi:hypothetical protein